MAWSIFNDIGEFFTGERGQQAEAGRSGLETAQTQYAQEQRDAAKRASQGVNQATNQLYDINKTDMGGSAAEYMQKADQAASAQASQAGQAAAKGSSRAALQAARTAGVNKGQAGLAGAQRAGDAYTQAYQGGLDSGRQQYANSIAQRSGNVQAAGALQSGLNANATSAANAAGGQAAQLNQAGAQNAQQSAAQGGGLLGGITSAIGSIFSDENLKENVTPSGDDSIRALIDKARGINRLKDLAQKVEPVDFDYKPGTGEDPSARNVGVMAQDLENTDMADNVKDTPNGKVVDVAKQTMSNTNYIVELSREIVRLADEVASLRGAK